MRIGKSAGWKRLVCHDGAVEVIPNLFCGSLAESIQMVSPPILVDVLIPLDSLDAKIWKLGFRGEILYCPVEDYGVLPDDVLADLVSKILDRLERKKKVGLFCLGGHGRTGYVASVVLGKLGYEDPIGFLRKKYCGRAVESDSQISHIARFLGKPELFEQYALRDIFFDGYDGFGIGSVDFTEDSDCPVCGNCIQFQDGICWMYRSLVSVDQDVCEDFIERREDRNNA